MNFSQKEETIFYKIPISKYFNRISNKKATGSKNQVRLQVLNQKLLITEIRSQSIDSIEQDSILIYNIDKVAQIQKPDEKYTLLRIQLNTVPQKQRFDQCITFRILNMALGREGTSFIRKKINQIKNLPNYVTIQEKQSVVMRSIILSEPQYDLVFRKAKQYKLLSTNNNHQILQFQRILLADHPEMSKFNLLKHTLKYQQQKNILIEKLKMNSSFLQENSQSRKALAQRKGNLNLAQTNINKIEIQADLQKIRIQGKQSLQGYSSKRQFQGFNLAGGEQQLYARSFNPSNIGTDNSELKKQNLILDNIQLSHQQDQKEQMFDNTYRDYNFGEGNQLIRGSSSRFPSENQKMEIEEGQIMDNKVDGNSYNKMCKKIKIPEIKDIKLQQKKQETRSQKKNQIRFIDPSYDPQKQKSLTKITVIWCRLFYHFMKDGGIQRRQRQLTSIESELKILKNTQKDVQMNELVARMVDKVSFNYLRMKRGQDVY